MGDAGLKMSSVGRCPHPDWSDLTLRRCNFCHVNTVSFLRHDMLIRRVYGDLN